MAENGTSLRERSAARRDFGAVGFAGGSVPPAAMVAGAIAVARHRFGPARKFAAVLGQALDGTPMSRQGVYMWEVGINRVPAAALVIAARLVRMPVEELLDAGERFACGRPDKTRGPGSKVTAGRGDGG